MDTIRPNLRVLVYGGTGSQARPLVHELIARGHQATVLTRDPARAADLAAAGARLVAGDLADPASLAMASAGAQAVAFLVPAFLAQPERALDYTRSALHAAREAGVAHVVWNTGGNIPDERGGRAAGSHVLAIWAVLRAVGLPLTVIAPTTYMENLLGPWTAESVRAQGRVSYPVLASRRMGWIASRDVGALMVAALERPSLAGRVYRVSGIEALTGPELARAFADVLARPIGYYAMSPEEMGAALDRAFGPGAGVGVAEEYRKDQLDPDPPAKYHDMSGVLRDLPVAMMTIRTWIAEHRAAFGGA